jgi:hypothetical protein
MSLQESIEMDLPSLMLFHIWPGNSDISPSSPVYVSSTCSIHTCTHVIEHLKNQALPSVEPHSPQQLHKITLTYVSCSVIIKPTQQLVSLHYTINE